MFVREYGLLGILFNMNVAKIMTPRLNTDWDVIFAWAIENDVEDSLKLLVDCTLIHSNVFHLPTVIDRLGSNNGLETLSRWSKSNSYSYHLEKLILTYKVIPVELLKANVLADSKSAKTQYYGELDLVYLMSAVVERIPTGTLAEIKWFERLRLWLVVQSMYAAASHNLQDTYLRELFRYLRIAADKLSDKLNLINQLMVDVNGYHQFTREIEQKAKQLTSNKNLKTNDLSFLKTLIKICNLDFHPEHFAQIHPTYQVARTLNRVADSEDLSGAESQQQSPYDHDINIIELYDKWDVDFGIEVDVDPNLSQPLKTLNGNSVLLSTVEELQFLPWSWNKPNPIEIKLLLEATNQLLLSEKEDEQVLAAFTWIAINTGRSFRRTLNIQISDIQDDWTLNIKAGMLVRNQPRRQNTWLPKSQEEKSWVIPIVKQHEIAFPEPLVSILNNQLSKSPTVKFLKQFWNESEWGGSEAFFLEKMEDILPRLTPGMLSNCLPQKIFESTENDKLTRILSSHPKTGLPPASAYSAWLQNVHPQIFNQFISASQVHDQNRIAVGSRLYPEENLLKEAILKAGNLLEKIRQSGDLIEYHNYLTGYLYTMILASSGTRPINDLVESVEQFDFDDGYFYVDDKSNSSGNKGRLIALPLKLINFVRKDYLMHLRVIAQSISIEKSPLAAEIDLLSSGLHSDKMPFMFFIKAGDTLDWESVSSSKINAFNLFDWPLPANLFRHRLAKLLPLEGIHQEIIDGLLGHVETGLESYGDFSTRCFLTDINSLRPALNKLFDHLGFTFPKHQPHLNIDQSLINNEALKARLYGSANRDKDRKARIINAIKAVKWEIEKVLRDKHLDALDEESIDALSKTMLFHVNGLPRSDGILRYEYFIKCINRHTLKSGRRVKFKKQYVFSETSSPFSPTSIGATTKYLQILAAVSELIATKSLSRFSATDAAMLTSFLFCVENRVSDKDLLLKIFMGTHYRIVKLQTQYYVEFALVEKPALSMMSAKRFPISNLCAYWMQNAKTLGLSRTYLNKAVTGFFEAISNIVPDKNYRINKIQNLEQLMHGLCEVINQANVVVLPGILAGYLSGRVSSYSWNWPEFVRFQMGAAYRLDYASCAKGVIDSDEEVFDEFLPASEKSAVNFNEEALQRNAKALFKQVREVLANEKNERTDKKKSREGLVKRINTLLNQYAASVSQSNLLLVVWVKSLINTKRSRANFYTISTIERYFSALSTKFEILAYVTSLVEMDEEDITEFYSNILRLSKDKDKGYVGQRLLGFHRWLRRQGVEEPDWSEIDIPDLVDVVSPGFIFEEDYQNALMLLMQSSTHYEINDRLSGLLLLLTYRFGLRGKEALGLLASDFFVEGDMIVISVTDNRIRTLKSPASRRQVPLVFKLSKSEKSMIEWCLNQLSSIPGLNKNTPLFNNKGNSLSEMMNGKIKHNVMQVLKQVTANPDISIHHARHTVANKIAYELFRLNIPYVNKEFEFLQPVATDMLLGTSAPTRREAWASARYLGHATRITQLKSYIHFIGDWAAQYAKPIKQKKQYEVEGVLDIGQFVKQVGEIDFSLYERNQTSLTKEKVTLVDLIQLFRLLANGKKVEVVGETLGIPLETANYAYSLLSAVTLKSYRFDSKEDGLGIFQKTSPAVWKRLFEFIKTIDDESLGRLDHSEINFHRLLPIFGSRGHILMRTEFQFKIMKAFIEVFDVPPTTYDVLMPKTADKKIISLAENYDFRPVIIGSNTPTGQAYKGYQLDTYFDNLENESFVQRCGIVFKEENTGYARNSNNWGLLVIIFITYLRSLQILH